MNPETSQTPREQIEVRLTALLLGEVPDAEATALRELLRHDAALAKLHDSLKQTIEVVRAAAVKQGEPASAQAPPKLSEERRQQLLAQFKTRPAGQKASATAKPASDVRTFFGTRGGVFWKRREMRWLVPVAATVVMLLLAAVMVPNFVRARSTAMSSTRISPMAQLQRANPVRQDEAFRRRYGLDAGPATDQNIRRPARVLRASEGKPAAAPAAPSAEALAIATPPPPAATTPPLEPAPTTVSPPRTQIVLPSVTENEAVGGSKGTPSAKSREDSWGFGGPVNAGEEFRAATAPSVAGEPQALGVLETKAVERYPRVSAATKPPQSPTSKSRRLGFSLLGPASPPDSPDTGLSHYDYKVGGPAVTVNNGSIAGDAQFGRPVMQQPRLADQLRKSGEIVTAWEENLGNFKVPVLGDSLALGKLFHSESQSSYASVEQGVVAREAPAVGQQFFRLVPGTGGGGMGGGGGQTQPAPADVPPGAPLAPALADSAAMQTKGVELVPFQLQLPAPSLKGAPADLPSGPTIEPLGDKPTGTIVLGIHDTAETGPHGTPAAGQQMERLHQNSSSGRFAGITPLPKAETLARNRDDSELSAGGRIVPEEKAVSVDKYEFGRAQDAAGKALAKKAPTTSPIVLPSASPRAGTVESAARTEAESRHSLGLDDGSAKTLDRRIAQAQQQVAELRKNQGISEADAMGIQPGPLLEAETLRQLKGRAVEAQAQYTKDEKLLEQIKAIPPQDLKKILPTAVPDATLNEYSQQLNLAEQERIRLKKDLSDESPAVGTVTKQIEDLNRKIADRSQGIIKGLESSVASLKAYQDSIETDVRKAKELDIAKSETSRPYYEAKRKLEELQRARKLLADKSAPAPEEDRPIRRPAANAPIPQPEVQTSDNAFSTFSLNVSDVAFKLAAASLEKGQMPDAASVRSEEFINAFDYRDPEPPPGVPVAFAWERARYPFAHNRDLLRFSIKTGAAGRQAGRPLNLVLLLDNSGSMERADRVQIIREALGVLASELQPQDTVSVITFSRTARLWVDGISGSKAGEVFEQVGGLTPQGGTNLEEAMRLAYATALRHYLASGINRVVLLTDGAANLGNVDPDALKQAVELHRKQGIALDCFGIGWEGFNDDLLEVLSRNGDGRYGFINSPEEAADDFAAQLAGALKVAASDVKVQVEFNPARVTAYRQIGYAKHQLTKEQFRDNTVDAAEIAPQEAGNALYTVEVNPAGAGPLCTVRCRFKIPGTTDYREHAWEVPFTGNAVSLEQASPAMRLAATASAFSEWLVASPFAAEVTPDRLLGHLARVPEVYGADPRPKKLEWMIRQAKSIEGK